MNAMAENRIFEALPGPERREVLRRHAESMAPGEEWWLLDCHFEHGGLWAGIKDLFQSVVPLIQEGRPNLITRHDYELVHVLPELRKTIEIRNPTLTDTASYEEKTRNYPADRALRIIHGLIDLVDAWRREAGSGRWLLACDHVDEISHTGRLFLRELWRRRGEDWGLVLIAGVSPGNAESVGSSLGLDPSVGVTRLDLAPASPSPMDPDEARRQAEILEKAVGQDQIEIQIHLPELIRLRQQAQDERQVLNWHCWGLEIYNTLGFYEDALVYGEGTLAQSERISPDNIEVHWSIFVKLFMSLAGLNRPQEALALAMPTYDRIETARHKGQLCFLIAMLHGRYLPERNYDLAEEFLDRGLELLKQADLPAEELHFQSVFNRNGLAMIRTFQRRFDDALRLCHEGLRRLEAHLEPDAHRLHRSVLFYNMAQVHAYIGAIPQALENFSAAMEMDPYYSEYYNERGSILLQVGHLEEALVDYKEALELSPPYHELYSNLGQCYRLLGRFGDAVTAYERSLDLRPAQVVALLGRAQALEGLGHSSEALADYNSVLDIEPDQWQARAARAVLLYGTGEYAASRQDLDLAIEEAPKTPELFQNRAVVLAELGLSEAAIDDLSTYLRLSPNADDRSEVEARVAGLRQQQVSALS